MVRVIRLELSDDPWMAELTGRYIRELCRRLCSDEGRSDLLCMALEKILSGRLGLAYQKEGGIFIVELELLGKKLRLSVADRGLPYWFHDPGLISDGTNPAIDLSFLTQAGLSYGIDFPPQAGQRIYFELPLLEPAKAPLKELVKVQVLDADFVFHEMRPCEEDIIEAIRCIYDEYGFTYGHEYLYQVENFKSALHRHDFEAFLARNAHKQAAGYQYILHSAHYPGMPELGACIVKHAFRGYGIATLGLDDAIRRAESSGSDALLVHPAAYHSYTQKIGAKKGFIPTGMMLNYIHPDIQTSFNTGQIRMPLAVASLRLKPSEPFDIYPPERHRLFFERRFSALGLAINLRSPLSAGCEDSILSVEYGSLLRAAFLFFEKIGKNFDALLKDYLHDSLKKRCEMVILHINLRDPACSWAFELALKRGFHFMGGVLGARGVDYLIMQNYMGIPIMGEIIRTEPDYAEVLDYCREFMPAEIFI